MKKIYTKGLSVSVLTLSVFFAASLLYSTGARAQIYYSTFDNPTGKYVVTEPSGGLCTAPVVVNAANIADKEIDNYASFSGLLITTLTCDQPYYSFKTDLNLPPDSLTLSPDAQAGFKIRVPSGADAALLGANLVINTYINDSLVESRGAGELLGLDVHADSVFWFVYANTAKSFNKIELRINAGIIAVGIPFELDVYYGFGAASQVLPVTISNFNAAVNGKNANISWQAFDEVNVSRYSLERSSDGGAAYTAVASVAAKGGGAYSYTDILPEDGNYLYRLKIIDKDGSFTTTGSAFISISGQGKLLVYPSVAKQGQNINVKTSVTGSYSTVVYDAQGRMVRQQRNTSGSSVTIATNGLSNGTYVIKVITATGSVMQSKFIVN